MFDSIFKPLIERTLELLVKKHGFQFELTDIDRNTTKNSWKKISQWLRVARNKVENEINQEEITKSMVELTSFGSSVLKI